MSVIAIENIPVKIGLKVVAKIFAKVINGRFEVLNFLPPSKGSKKKVYINLSEKLDPWCVVERINNKKFGQHSFYATVPNVVPDLPLSKHPKNLSRRLLKEMNLSRFPKEKKIREKPQPTISKEKIREKPKHQPTISKKERIHLVLGELMKELQAKYTGLVDLNKKVDGKLLDEISKAVKERLKKIMHAAPHNTCFRFSQSYRSKFPHDGDLKLIESVAKKHGAINGPLTDVLMKPPPVNDTRVGDLPFENVLKACEEYGDRIYESLVSHINSLQTSPDPNKSPEGEADKIRVRRAFHKLKPYIPAMIRMLLKKNVIPEEDDYTVVRIYGEPSLPSRRVLMTLMKKFEGEAKRSHVLFNLVTVKVAREQAATLYALDCAVVSGCTIIVRPFIVESVHENRFKDAGNAEEHEEGKMEFEDDVEYAEENWEEV